MSITNWGELTKALDDPETIEEAIERLIGAHDENVDAHLGANGSLLSHKASEIIDHLAESVVNDKMQILARAFTAIVDPNGAGDYTNIQDAIDFVVSKGGGNVLIANGVHNVDYDITMNRLVDLVGVGKSLSVIDFGGTTKRIKGDAVFIKDYELTEHENASTTFIFDTGMTIISDGVKAGMYLDQEGEQAMQYKILSVDSETQVTLDTAFAEGSEDYIITIHEGPLGHNLIENLTIKNSSYSGAVIDCENKLYIDVDEVEIIGCLGLYSNGLLNYYPGPVSRISRCDFSDNSHTTLFTLNNVHFNDNDVRCNVPNGVVFDMGSNCMFVNNYGSFGGTGSRTLFKTHSAGYQMVNNRFYYQTILFNEAVGATGVYLANNYFYTQSSVDSEFSYDRSVIVGNTIYSGSGKNFKLVSGTSYIVLVGNIIYTGVVDSGTNNVVEHNAVI